jgi:hypothetical protein
VIDVSAATTTTVRAAAAVLVIPAATAAAVPVIPAATATVIAATAVINSATAAMPVVTTAAVPLAAAVPVIPAAAPAVPAVSAAPPIAFIPGETAQIEARTLPPVIVPAIVPTAVKELDLLDRRELRSCHTETDRAVADRRFGRSRERQSEGSRRLPRQPYKLQFCEA